jgi:hypothetical protein
MMGRRRSQLLSAIWWVPKDVEVSNGKVFPIEPFRRYDPFDDYYPKGIQTTTRSTRSLCYEFLDVDANDMTRILDFCRQYGVLGAVDQPGWMSWMLKVTGKQSFLEDSEMDDNYAFPKLHEQNLTGELSRKVAGLRPDHSLCTPMELYDFRKAQEQLRETASWFEKPKRFEDALEVRFRWKLSMVRPTPRRAAKTWVMDWEVGSLEAVMYLMLLFDASGGGSIRHCRHCQRPFLSTRSQGLYCSEPCQNTHKVTAYRERQRKLRPRK